MEPLKLDLTSVKSTKKDDSGYKAAGMKIHWSDYSNIAEQLGLPPGVSGGVLMDTLTTKLTEAGIPLGFLSDETPKNEVTTATEKWVGKKYSTEDYNESCKVLGIPPSAGGAVFFKTLLLKAIEKGIIKS